MSDGYFPQGYSPEDLVCPGYVPLHRDERRILRMLRASKAGVMATETYYRAFDEETYPIIVMLKYFKDLDEMELDFISHKEAPKEESS